MYKRSQICHTLATCSILLHFYIEIEQEQPSLSEGNGMKINIFVLVGMLGTLTSFILLVFAMLGVASYFIAVPLLFLFILFTVHVINTRKRFRGFH